MLPFKHRLVKRRDFDAVYKKGRFFYFGDIKINLKENNLSQARIGFNVGTKYSHSAVERNKIKRQLRGIIKSMLSGINPGYDIVVSPKKALKNPEYKNLEKNVKEALIKADILTK